MNRPVRKLILLTLVFLAIGPASMADDEGKLDIGTVAVTVSGFRNRKGQVCVSLFDSKKGFPTDYDQALRTHRGAIKGKTVNLYFKNVPPGKYAVAVLHDENKNNKMDTTFFGFPKEGAGVSNNPKPRRGPPRFEDAEFVLGKEALKLQIKLQYP